MYILKQKYLLYIKVHDRYKDIWKYLIYKYM